jgi:hypothetical protein
MGASEQEKIEQFRRRLESLTQEEVDRYWAERQDAERQAELDRRRREHFLHQLGMALMWVASVAFAFGVGYSVGRTLSRTFALIWVWCVLGGLLGGLALMSVNRHRRDQ